MAKLSKIFFIIGILLMNFCCYSYAVTTSTTISSNTTQSTSTQSTLNENSSNTNTTKLTSSQYSTAVTASNFDLQLTNILSICLIVVGVLLILLAIAILIRLKN